ncbi:MAG: efflux RND transporter periplasmic adaptor subunit, partial [Verrucomicrobiae bacterium]|nr:efflux RND transporter periplasmic adaptor subunit [Verrucomicrobiae bacterium]
GMSVSSDIETRYRTNVLTVPIQSVTTRAPDGTNAPAGLASVKDREERRERLELGTADRRKSEGKPPEVVFTVVEGKAKALPVRRGISDDQYYEIESGVTEGLEVVSGSFRAIARDLQTDKSVRVDNSRKDSSSKAKPSGPS